MPVTWVLNESSRYEVSSKDHLLQIMHQGSLYTDAGTPPSIYWESDYEQTVDIDLGADSNISPIGTSGDNFKGKYDGGNFSISNWSYTAGLGYAGLFGYARDYIIENIRLAGVWTSDGSTFATGFLLGRGLTGGIVRNIECTFDEGTYINNHNASFVGAMIGMTSSSTMYGLTVKGFVDTRNTNNRGSIGGVVGILTGGGVNVGLRNTAVWKNGMTGVTMGGVVGELLGDTVLTHAVNSMVGDITGTTCGGICGYTQRGVGDPQFNTLVNSMNGDITGANHAGGIIGHTYCDSGNLDLFDATNYMTGDVVSTNGTSGGMIGSVTQEESNTCTVSNAVVAMNGSSDEAVVGSAVSTTVSAKIDTSFGFTYTTATFGSISDAFTGTTSTLLPELSFIPLVFTDDESNSYEWEMIFGNVGGNANYSQYTHAIISKNDISGPYHIDFDLAAETTEFVTYITDGDAPVAYTDGAMTVLHSSASSVFDYAGSILLFGTPLPASFEVSHAGAIDVTVSIDAIAGAEAYQLRHTPTTGGTPLISHSGFTELTKVVSNLDPEVEYQISLYYIPAGMSDYRLDGSKTVTTLANVAANYDLSSYGSAGEYDLSGISNMGNISDVMNEIFTSGDEISINIGRPTKTTFVKLGETLAIPEGSVLLPFTKSNGHSQQVTLALTHAETETITYNEASEEITVGGSTYSDGSVFILNGKKAEVFNV